MQKLYTPAGEALRGVPWNAYPRPQMVRKDWLCLNGEWDFAYAGTKAVIRVPFCPESLLSGIGKSPDSPNCSSAPTCRSSRSCSLPPSGLTTESR